MNCVTHIWIALALVSFASLYATDPEPGTTIIITANRLGTPADQIASTTQVIQLGAPSKGGSVAQALREVPGLDVVNTGGSGQTTSVFLRGSNSEHLLVLIDGIEVNDPSSPARSFDFGRLNLDNVDRIEVVKGPQSVLYGSDAMSGVINIITKKGSGPGKGGIHVEGGSFNTLKGSVRGSGGDARFNYSMVASRSSTSGFSAANSLDGNTEADGYRQTDITARVGGQILEKLHLSLNAKMIHSNIDLDRAGGPGNDDPNFTQNTTQYFVRLQDRSFFLEDKWETILGFNYSWTQRNSINTPDANDATNLSEIYRGQLYRIDWQNNIELFSHTTLTFGADYKTETGESSTFAKTHASEFGIYLQQRSKWQGLFTTLGLRYDKHSQQGVDALTYRIAPGYRFEITRTTLRLSVGEGFKVPTLFQLRDPIYGNPNLKPERLFAWEVGLDQEIRKKSSAGLVFFDNSFRNLIQYDFTTSQNLNVGKATTRGIEASTVLNLHDSLSVSGSYTHLFELNNTTSNAKLVRRPKNKFRIGIDYTPTSSLTLNAQWSLTGARDDYDATTFVITELGAYHLLGLRADWQWQRFTLSARIENLTDTRYEEVDGFGTAGLSFYGGLSVDL